MVMVQIGMDDGDGADRDGWGCQFGSRVAEGHVHQLECRRVSLRHLESCRRHMPRHMRRHMPRHMRSRMPRHMRRRMLRHMHLCTSWPCQRQYKDFLLTKRLFVAERAAIYDGMNAVLAKLHSIDTGSAGLSGFGKAEGFYARQIATWSKQYQASKTEDTDR